MEGRQAKERIQIPKIALWSTLPLQHQTQPLEELKPKEKDDCRTHQASSAVIPDYATASEHIQIEKGSNELIVKHPEGRGVELQQQSILFTLSKNMAT